MVFVNFSSLRFSSLKSFCALRHTPKVVLQTWEPVQALGFLTPNGVFFFFARVLHMDNMSRHLWVASKNLRYTIVVRSQTTIKNILQKSSSKAIFIIISKSSHMLFMFLNKCSHVINVKQMAVLGKS